MPTPNNIFIEKIIKKVIQITSQKIYRYLDDSSSYGMGNGIMPFHFHHLISSMSEILPDLNSIEESPIWNGKLLFEVAWRKWSISLQDDDEDNKRQDETRQDKTR
jgi:hypothetical protein